MSTTTIDTNPVAAVPLLLRDHEAAELLSISREKMYLMMRSGEIPGVVHIGRSIRVHRPTLEKWLSDQAARP